MKKQFYGTDGASLKPLYGKFANQLSTAREWDSESQTYHYRARRYNPYVGRFTARDQIGYIGYEGGINLYTYVMSRPTILTDPEGKIPPQCLSAAGQTTYFLYGYFTGLQGGVNEKSVL